MSTLPLLIDIMKKDMDTREMLTKWDTFILALENKERLCVGACECPTENNTDGDCQECNNTKALFVWRAVLEDYLDIINKATINHKSIRMRSIIRQLTKKYNLNINNADFKIAIENMFDMCYTESEDKKKAEAMALLARN